MRRSGLYIAALASAACAAEPGPASPQAGLGFEPDAYCSAGNDIFAGEGDGRLSHYWRHNERLIHVRDIATNHDVSQCEVEGAYVYYLDPNFGVLGFQRDAETDLRQFPVYLAPPAGAGRFNPASFSVVKDGVQPVLTVRSADGDRDSISLPEDQVDATTPRQVVASLETHPVDDDGDAADDAVVLATAAHAWIVGTDKTYGLRVYSMDGKQQQALATGRLNNVDALVTDDGSYLLAASNRSTQSIDLFTATPAGDSANVEYAASIALPLDDPYGLCMGRVGEAITVFVGDKDGNVQRWTVANDLTAELAQEYTFASQTEGCVYDHASDTLYVGEEEHGVWKLPADDSSRELFAAVDGEILSADVEGIDILPYGDEQLLVVSSQGDDRYALFDTATADAVTSFRIVANLEDSIDGTSETDGLAVFAAPIPGFEHGILVVQDGRNAAPAANQNFKVVDLKAVLALLPAK